MGQLSPSAGDDMRSSVRALTLIEVTVAFAIMAIIAAGSFYAYQAVKAPVQAKGAVVLLETARMEAHKRITAGSFPSTPTDLSSTALPVAAEPAGVGTVGAYFPSATVVVLSTPTEADCLVMVDSIGSPVRYGKVLGAAASCSPLTLWAHDAQITGTSDAPSEFPL
jgi:type II secretory pathway pseudopilin PulG